MFRSNSCKLAFCYLALTLIFGSILLVYDIRPSTNDADQHWSRAYLISQGQFLAEESPRHDGSFGGFIDGSFVAFNNTAINSPLAYFPSWFCFGSFRAACVLTLLIASIITALAIYLSGRFSPLLLAAAILPMVFFSYLYPTADAMTNSVSLLFVGAVLYFYQKKRISWIAIAALTALGSIIGFLKVTCIILLLLLLLPFHRIYTDTHKLYWRFALPAFAGVVASFVWSRFTVGIMPIYLPYEQYQEAIRTILVSPKECLDTIFISLFCPLDCTDAAGNIGRNAQFVFGSEFTRLPITVMGPILLGCALLLIYGNRANECFSKIDITVILATALLFFAGTHVAMLASWAGINLGSYNQGIQTRYFIPELSLVGLLLPYLDISINKKHVFWVTTSMLIVYGYLGIAIAHIMPL